MSTNTQPTQPWLKGWTAEKENETVEADPKVAPEDESQEARGNPTWRKGMRSPNPKGRPKGIVDKRRKISLALIEEAHEITRVVVAKAKEGDLQAASLVLARVLPTLSSQGERVQFDLDPTSPLSAQVEQVLGAMSEGELSPDTAKQIIEVIGALGAIRQMDDVERRIAKLEAQGN